MTADITLCHLGFPFRTHEVITYAPVGMLYLVAALEGAGLQVDFRDYQLAARRSPCSLREVRRFLQGHAPVVGIGCMMKELPLAVLTARALKEARPETFVLLGGTGPSPVARALLEAFPWVDAVAVGEADVTLVEAVRALKAGTPLDGVAGLVLRQGQAVVATAERSLVADLDALPLPAYASVDVSGYNTVYISGSRGCVFRCTFCDQPVFWRKCLRSRAVGAIFRELAALACLKSAWNVTFADNVFCTSPQALEEFVREYRRSPMRFSFGANQRVGLVSRETTAQLREMDTRLVLLGIESGSVPVLRRIGKAFSPPQVLEAIRVTSDAIPLTVASFMYGYPFETLEDFLQTLELIRTILATPTRHPVVIQLHHLSPLAGTPLLEEYRDWLCPSASATVVTSSDNQGAYRVTTFQDGKVLVTPSGKRGRRECPRAIHDLVRAHPAIFPSFSAYRTPDRLAKERVLTHLIDITASAETSRAIPLGRRSLVVDEGPLRLVPS